METSPSHQRLQRSAVWQKGMELAKQVYLLTNRFPSEEKFGLVIQMRRAAVSVPSNIAEGQSRNTTGEFIQFLSHAEGSAAELDTPGCRCDLNCVSAPSPKLTVVRQSLIDSSRMRNQLTMVIQPNEPTPPVTQPLEPRMLNDLRYAIRLLLKNSWLHRCGGAFSRTRHRCEHGAL